ncbi:hypothetical protein CEF21_20665 [Bacillus sp. FJAT-42376]|nr:hypothetical protein CEF21_20665 [Bacillus sp. FJAT-42376]
MIKKGETLSSAVKKNKTVLIQDIKEVRLDRHFYSFRGLIFEDLIITAKKGKRIRIPTYNLLGPVVFDQMVRSYILPYMDESDREVWLKNNKGFHFAESNQAPD